MILLCGVVAVGAVAAIAIATATAAPVASPARVVTAGQLTAYQAAITPTLQAAGAMVENEVKTSIASLEQGVLTAAQMRARATSWLSRFAADRAALATVSAPAGLAAAVADFDRAFASYEAAVRALGGLADNPTGAQVQAAIDTASATARSADGLYDAASAIIQAARRADGLGATADLPDPTPAG